jgi:hypothetical protein
MGLVMKLTLRSLRCIWFFALSFSLAAQALAQDSALAFITPTANAEVINGATFKMQVNLAGVSKVELSADGFRFGDLTTSNNWTLGYTFTNLGSRRISARGLSAAGAELGSNSIDIKVVEMATNSLVEGALYGNSRAVIVRASARIKTVVMSSSGFELGRSSARTGDGDLVIDPVPFNQLGARAILLDAFDASGAKIASLTRNVTVTNLAWLSPAAGASIAADTAFDLRVESNRNATKVIYTADGNALAESSDPSSKFRAVVKLLNAGQRTLLARALNTSGQQIAESSITVTVPGAGGGGTTGTGAGFGGAAAYDRVISVANTSGCLTFNFPDRGRAPRGFIKGMALSYAKSYCEAVRGDQTAVTVISAPMRNDSKDVLFHYGLNSSSNLVRLRTLYVLGIGSGMRESSGNTTEGYDVSAGSPTAEGAEAGLYQTSYNSRNLGESGTWLTSLQNSYRNSAQCNLSVFLEGVTDKRVPVVGSGAGAEFQRQTKTCPSFATEYALVVFRQNKNHYGPLVRKEVPVVAACTTMLQQVETVVTCR